MAKEVADLVKKNNMDKILLITGFIIIVLIMISLVSKDDSVAAHESELRYSQEMNKACEARRMYLEGVVEQYSIKVAR